MRASTPNFQETDLREVPDEWLLYMVQGILSLPGKVTAQQRRELQQINREVRRREYAAKVAAKEARKQERAQVAKAVTQLMRAAKL